MAGLGPGTAGLPFGPDGARPFCVGTWPAGGGFFSGCCAAGGSPPGGAMGRGFAPPGAACPPGNGGSCWPFGKALTAGGLFGDGAPGDAGWGFCWVGAMGFSLSLGNGLPVAPGNAWAGNCVDGMGPGWPGRTPGAGWPGVFCGSPELPPPINVAFLATDGGRATFAAIAAAATPAPAPTAAGRPGCAPPGFMTGPLLLMIVVLWMLLKMTFPGGGTT